MTGTIRRWAPRFRLKASYQIAPSLRADTKAVLQAMKTYGLVLADNGHTWYFRHLRRWLAQRDARPTEAGAGSAFEAVDTSSLRLSRDSMQVKPQP